MPAEFGEVKGYKGRPERATKSKPPHSLKPSRLLHPDSTHPRTTMTITEGKKLILVIGATGAQGIAVIDALLAPAKDGKQSPFAIRALSRDPESKRAKELTARGIEVVKGE